MQAWHSFPSHPIRSMKFVRRKSNSQEWNFPKIWTLGQAQQSVKPSPKDFSPASASSCSPAPLSPSAAQQLPGCSSPNDEPHTNLLIGSAARRDFAAEIVGPLHCRK